MLLKIVALALCISCTSASIKDDCLACICDVESSGCNPLPCADDAGSLSCGYYHIKQLYYHDCGSLGSGWHACSLDKNCASECVRNYMVRYGRYCTEGIEPTCEDYARIHKGGPLGCQKPATEGYWKTIKACMDRVKQ